MAWLSDAEPKGIATGGLGVEGWVECSKRASYIEK